MHQHLVECLAPTNVICNQKMAEYMVRISGPVENCWNSTKVADKFTYTMVSGEKIIYDFDKVVNFAAERTMKVKEILVTEQMLEIAKGTREKMENIRVIRTMQRERGEHAETVPVFHSTSMNTNLSTGGEFCNRNTTTLLTEATKKIKQMLQERKPIMAKYLTTESTLGLAFGRGDERTSPNQVVKITGLTPKILMVPKTANKVWVDNIDPEVVRQLGRNKLLNSRNLNRLENQGEVPTRYQPKTFKRSQNELGQGFANQLAQKNDRTTKTPAGEARLEGYMTSANKRVKISKENFGKENFR